MPEPVEPAGRTRTSLKTAMANQTTELIYLTYEGNFKFETDATVVHCKVIPDETSANQNNVRIELQLDQTTMHPQGGGQPTDIGTISCNDNLLKAQIDKVTIDRGTGAVTHAGSISLPSDAIDLESALQSKPVKVSVDPENRRILSECHTAGHVVDAAMAKCRALLPPTKGYHFLDGPYVEYKGTIDNKEEFLTRLQNAYCQLIEEDIATTIQTVHMDEADAVCNRVAKNFNIQDFCSEDNPNVRVVSVAGFSCPCGGTHVKSTGELKERGWSVKGLRCKKGIVRVRYGPKD